MEGGVGGVGEVLKALTPSTHRVLTNFVVIFRPNSKLDGVCGSNLAESDGM